MSYDRQRVIDVAESQLGYHEKESNSQLDDPKANPGDQNWNKYAKYLDSLGNFYNGPKNIGPNGAWCDIFVDWCFVTAYGRAGAQFLLCQPNNSAGAGCSFSAQYFNAKGQFHKSGPQPGDQIFFGDSWGNVWHTGLVVEVTSTRVVTVEGNTSDMVAKRSYALNATNIWGYGRPDWGTQEASSDAGKGNDTPAQEAPQKPAEEPQKGYWYNVRLPLLMLGDKGGYVKAAQALLIAQGYDCGNKPLIGYERPDGEFGRATQRAVGFLQSKNHLEVDGEIGGATWAALLKL